MSERYECDKCGACCKALIVEIQHVDLVREPRLRAVARLLDGDGTITYESVWDKEYGLACGKTSPCKLLGPDDLCTIYRTRPNVCVAFQAGDEQCQMARESMGLAALMPMVS